MNLPFAQKSTVFSLVYAENPLTFFWCQKTTGQFKLGIRNPDKKRENQSVLEKMYETGYTWQIYALQNKAL